MDPKKLFFDDRFKDICVYCGVSPSTRDHVPSRVLLDEPYPNNLPVVPACKECNNSFSKDEQYLACFLECVITGSTDLALLQREKVKCILGENPALAMQIQQCLSIDIQGNKIWTPKFERVLNVVMKLARGHAAYECAQPQFDEPEYVSILPIIEMSQEQIDSFNTPPKGYFLPEIGSRAFHRAIVINGQLKTFEGYWLVVQDGRYRYSVSYSNGIMIRMILNEYLACEVKWG